ncbi:MAG: hypothetical protein DMG30_13890 [Acidobacteria bacterium]|nr:MAG: hypothetical protein DMG30_13890 [Acidobacteriota bacterium]
MAFLPITIFFVIILWFFGFYLMDRKQIGRMTSIGCFILVIPLVTVNLEYITENSGVLATSTLALSSMLQSTIVLVDVFFLFMALVSLFDFYGRNWHGGK